MIKLRPHQVALHMKLAYGGPFLNVLCAVFTDTAYGKKVYKKSRDLVKRIRSIEKIKVVGDISSELCDICPYKSPCSKEDYQTVRKQAHNRLGKLGHFIQINTWPYFGNPVEKDKVIIKDHQLEFGRAYHIGDLVQREF